MTDIALEAPKAENSAPPITRSRENLEEHLDRRNNLARQREVGRLEAIVDFSGYVVDDVHGKHEKPN